VEIDSLAAETYRMNHPDVKLLQQDIRTVSAADLLPGNTGFVQLVAGCPPCQGFSRVRRKNRTRSAADNRNWLIDEFQRIVVELLPAAVFLENVPGIENYHRFKSFLQTLTDVGYEVGWKTLDLYNYGVPQRRRRVVVVAGLGFRIDFPSEARTKRTVRSAIGDLAPPAKSRNRLFFQSDAARLREQEGIAQDYGQE
jgi:DNA (cytosine-5)-methyltransferase 1